MNEPRLPKKVVQQFHNDIRAGIASGNPQAISFALGMITQLLTGESISGKVASTFTNEIIVMKEAKKDEEYLIMWDSFTGILDRLYDAYEQFKEDNGA